MDFKVSLRKITLKDEDTGQERALLAVRPLDDIVELVWEREQELAVEQVADDVFAFMSHGHSAATEPVNEREEKHVSSV